MNHHNQTQSNFTHYYDKELEEVVLGSLLLETESLDRIDKDIHIGLFYNDTNAILFQNISEMKKKNIPVDIVTLSNYMRDNKSINRLQEGIVTIASLTDRVSSTIHLEYHVSILKRFYLKRETVLIGQKLIRSISEGEEAEDVMRNAIDSLSLLEDGNSSKDDLQHISSFLSKSIKSAYKRVEDRAKGVIPGVPTGLKDLDKVINGWQNGKLIIIAARPAMGKTAFCLKFAKSAAQQGYNVAIFSLEMDGESLSDRLILSETKSESWRYAGGYLNDKELVELEKDSGSLFNLPIYIDDNTNSTIRKIQSKSRVLQKKQGCDMIIIDYLQLAENDEKTGNREQEIAAVSRACKKMSRTLNVPVILLSQLSRQVEGRSNKRPMLSDLRESGAIEQDADMVCFLYRADYYKDASGIQEKLFDPNGSEVNNGVEFIIAKNRNGATGSIIVQHDGTLNKIYDYNTGQLPF